VRCRVGLTGLGEKIVTLGPRWERFSPLPHFPRPLGQAFGERHGLLETTPLQHNAAPSEVQAGALPVRSPTGENVMLPMMMVECTCAKMVSRWEPGTLFK